MEELNLYEILKGHEGEAFYSPLCGNVVIDELCNKGYSIRILDYKHRSVYLTSNGRFGDPNIGECMLFPSKDQRDWNKWIEEQKSKLLKTWSELVKSNKEVECHVQIQKTWGNRSYDSTKSNSPIEKSALALLKIRQLIEYGYGGNACPTHEHFFAIVYDWIDKEFCVREEDNLIVSNLILIGFHTPEQAEEFLKYPENVKLLKDYYMI